MALIKCKECGHDVSTTAKTCPNCGAPTAKARQTDTSTSVARIILMVLAVISIIPAILFAGGIGLIIPAVLFVLALILK
jgi:uncharacterized membrane protein YvbJ